MIALAFRHELLATWRSRARIGALIAFFVASGYAIVSGQRFHAQWTDALAAAHAKHVESAASARGWLESGASGPEDREWVNIAEPLWQDWYAGTRLLRLPAALAGIAVGSADDSPVVARVNRLADPFAASGVRLENPEIGGTHAIDLVFVFLVLVPILVGVLGLGIGSFERERGIARLVAVQAGASSVWFLARVVAVTAIVLAAVMTVCLVAVIATQAPFVDGARLMALAGSYSLIWGGILAALGVSARNVQEGALSFGLAWACFCLLIPSLLSERAMSAATTSYAVETSLRTRSEQYAVYKREIDQVLPELYDAFPQLRSMPASRLEELPAEVRRHAYDGIKLIALETRHADQHERELRAEEVALRNSWWSPSVSFAHGCERLAGRGRLSAAEFRDRVVASIRTRVTWVLESAWQQQSLGSESFDQLVGEGANPIDAGSRSVAHPMWVLAIWALVAWLLGIVRLRWLDRYLR